MNKYLAVIQEIENIYLEDVGQEINSTSNFEMNSERIKQLLCQFFQTQGNNSIVKDIENMQLSADSESSDLTTLLNLANLAGGELLLQNRIKPEHQSKNMVNSITQSRNIQQEQQIQAEEAVQNININQQMNKSAQIIELPAVLFKRANFYQKTKCYIPECKKAGLFRPIFDSSLQYSGIANSRFGTLYQEISISQLDEKTKQLIRPIAMSIKMPFYDYYSKMDGITRQSILTQPLTQIQHQDFEQFTGEYEILNQKFTEQMIQFFMLFRIKLLKLFKLFTLKQIKSSLKIFENFMMEQNNVLEIDLGKIMLCVRELPAKHFDALCIEMQLDQNENATESDQKFNQEPTLLFSVENTNKKETKKVDEEHNIKEQTNIVAKPHSNDPLLNLLYQQIEKIMENKFWSEQEKEMKIQPYLDQIKQLEQINSRQDDIHVSGSFSTSSFSSVNSNDIDDDGISNSSSDLTSPDGPGFVTDSSESEHNKGQSSNDENNDRNEDQVNEQPQDTIINNPNQQNQAELPLHVSHYDNIEQADVFTAPTNNVQTLGKSLWTEQDLQNTGDTQKFNGSSKDADSQQDDQKMVEIPVYDEKTIAAKKEKVAAKLLPIPNVKSNSEWFVRIRIVDGAVQIVQPRLPVTAYADLGTLRRVRVHQEILDDARFQTLQSRLMLMKDKNLLELLYSVLDDSNVNVQFPQHEKILAQLPPQLRQLCATQHPNELDMKVYFDGMRIGGSNMQQFAAGDADEDDEDEEALLDKVLIPGETIAGGRYRVEAACGAATFSNCYHVVDRAGRHLCLKVVKGQKEYQDSALDEVRLLMYVRDALGGQEEDLKDAQANPGTYDPAAHSHLIKLYDFFYYREHLMLVFPLLGEDLYIHYENRRQKRLPNDFSVDVIREIARQSLEALNALHSLGIYHLDVKPENVLVQKGFVGGLTPPAVTLIDLGSASFACDRLQSYIQSRSYRAPEIMFGAPYDSRADVWSIGAVLAEALTGKVLFPNLSVPTMLARMAALLGPFPKTLGLGGRVAQRYLTLGQLPYTESCILSPDNALLEQWLFGEDLYELGYREILFADFIRQALTMDAEKRPTAAMLLQHPFITE